MMTASNNRQFHTMHWHDALALLETGQPVDLRLWELSSGEILTYRNVVCIGGHRRRGLHRVRFIDSGEIRAFRDITLFEINGYDIYR